VQLKTGPGGHLGVLTGRAAQRTTWHWIDEFFARNETVKRPVAPRRRRRPAA
jgi:polyhydroxyalkanoate synthase